MLVKQSIFQSRLSVENLLNGLVKIYSLPAGAKILANGFLVLSRIETKMMLNNDADGIKLSEFYSIASSIPGVLYVQSLTVTPGSGGTSSSGNVLFTKKGSLPSLVIANTTVTLVSVDE